MFEVGDIVQGKTPAYLDYTITTHDATLEVVEVRGRNVMIVKVVQHRTRPDTIGSRHGVRCKDFIYLGTACDVVAVSSLDYMQSSELSDVDKILIEGALSCLK